MGRTTSKEPDAPGMTEIEPGMVGSQPDSRLSSKSEPILPVLFRVKLKVSVVAGEAGLLQVAVLEHEGVVDHDRGQHRRRR
jgi:hypothetical protein